ncbi:MAG: glycosyltransferase family 4 protein, partial [Clostridiales bacterium]|nr:glycosyltransferase family 4 protein [Clostridiales bacterium]
AHAYERLLFGLREYYANSKQTRNVVLHLVGEGPDLKKYEKIVTDMNLEKVVKFHGMINSSKLDELYNGFDLGVASLGLHRIGVECGSFLKSREYLAKGLPMITASKIDILEGQQFTFVERFPADESNISIEKIIKFHDRIYHNNESNIDVINNIRKFANEHCGIDNMTKPVLNFLINNSETNKLSY